MNDNCHGEPDRCQAAHTLDSARGIFAGQARLLANRADLGIEIGVDSLLRLALLAERLAAIEEGRK